MTLTAVGSGSPRRIDIASIGLGSGPRQSARLADPILRVLATTPRRFQESVRGVARRLLARRVAAAGVPTEVGAGDWILVLGAPWIAPGAASAAVALKRRTGARLAVLIHDLLPITAPKWYADKQSGEARDDVLQLVDAADTLFAVSTPVADELQQHTGRHVTALPPADPTFTKAPSVVASTFFPAGPYILFVGTLHPRKNVAALVRAITSIARSRGVDSAPRLVIAGRRHPQDSELYVALDECQEVPGLRDHIELIHDADDQVLATLYASCRFVVLPSLAEGWGIPVRESLGAGHPVIATDAVPAAIGSPFVKLVPAGDNNALTAAIAEWWSSSTPEKLAEQISQEFLPRTWESVASELIAEVTKR